MKKERESVSKELKLKLEGNKEAVSTVIGAMLLLAIVVIVYTTIQVSQVPGWNKGVELDHMNVVYSDMQSLKSDIENAAMLKTPKSSNIHLGVRYPNRMFFINPGVGVSGSLTVEDDVEIMVTYTNASGSYTETYNSSRITYEADGIINSPKLVYEHGIIIRDFGIRNRTKDVQSLIVENNIYIPVVSGSSNPTSSMETESLEIKPYTGTSTCTKVEYVNITMDTNYPNVWSDLLADVNTSETNAIIDISGKMMYINSSAPRYIVFPNQTATEALYSGIITFSRELPPGVVLIIPTITTQNATDVNETGATLNVTYDFKDYRFGEVRFAYKKSNSSWTSYTDWVSKSASGSYFEAIGGLTNNTLYCFKAQLKYDSTVIEGTEKLFTTT
jgi:hypothetical protein